MNDRTMLSIIVLSILWSDGNWRITFELINLNYYYSNNQNVTQFNHNLAKFPVLTLIIK